MNLYVSTFVARLSAFFKFYTTHFFVFVGALVGVWQLIPADQIADLYAKYPLLLAYKTEIAIAVGVVAYYKVKMKAQPDVEIPPTVKEIKKAENEAEINRL